jgi:hypothetical protein
MDKKLLYRITNGRVRRYVKMIFLLLFNGFFVSVLQGVDENSSRVGGVVWGNLEEVPWIKKMKLEGRVEDLPSSADLSSEMPPVGDQGTQCSCVGWAVGYYHKTHQEWIEHQWDITQTAHQFSPAFIYNLINGGINDVALGVDAFRVLRQHGCATLDKCPYDPSDHTTWPTEEAFESAIPYRAEKVDGLVTNTNDGMDVLKALLAWGFDGINGRTAVISVKVHDKFRNIGNYNNVFCSVDKDATPPDEEHALCVVGYDNNLEHRDSQSGPPKTKGAFKVVNSWDTTWGDGGYGWISYDAMKDADINSRGNGAFSHDRTDYSPTLLTRFKIDHPRREGIQLRFYIDDPVVPSWDTVFFTWERLQDPECYITPHPYPNHNIVFDLSDADADGNDVFDWDDVIYMEIEDVIADIEGGDGELEYLAGDYRGDPPGVYTAFDPPETRHIPDGGSVLVPLSRSSWERRYGGAGWDEGTSVVQADDGGYVVAGITNSFGSGGNDVLLFKTDDGGGVEWTQSLGGAGNDGANCVKKTADGGYIILGGTCSLGDTEGDVYLVKTDDMGTMEWEKTFGNVGEVDVGYSICLCADGGYIIGASRNYESDIDERDGWLIKTDSLGNMEWDKIYETSSYEYYFESVQQTADGGYIVAGEKLYVTDGGIVEYTRDFYENDSRSIPEYDGVESLKTREGANYLYILKTDSLGETDWEHSYGGAVAWGNFVQQTSDGGYIIAGLSSLAYAFLLKTDSAGDVEWYEDYGLYAVSRAYAAFETSDHGFILAGYTDWVGGNSGDTYVAKTDQLGNLEWEETYGYYYSGNEYSDFGFSAQQTDDDGLIIVGYTFSSSFEDIYLVKTPAGEGPSGIPIQELPPEEISADTSIISIYSSTPNPFFNEVNISYSLRRKCDVEISVHNIIGQKVKDFGREEKSSGVHTNSWNGLDNHGTELPSGIYFFRIEAGNEQAIRKLVLVR